MAEERCLSSAMVTPTVLKRCDRRRHGKSEPHRWVSAVDDTGHYLVAHWKDDKKVWVKEYPQKPPSPG
jgi:hypothetical protein